MASSEARQFQGKVALVTGSGRGIGRAIALRLAQEGADVIVHYFRKRASAEAVQTQIHEMGRRSWLFKANLGEIDEIERLFDEIERQIGALDILVNNAASGYNRSVMQQKPKGWEWTMNINARAALFCAQRAAKLMQPRGGGCIVNISSPGSQRVLPDYVVVGASKAALEALTRYLAVELAELNIVVNAVSPGMVLTEALEHFAIFRQQEQLLQRAIRLTPAGRLVTPEDVAGVVAFLCSPAAHMIRGQVIVVDGGYTLPISGATQASSLEADI